MINNLGFITLLGHREMCIELDKTKPILNVRDVVEWAVEVI
jgi:hypothetical protein